MTIEPAHTALSRVTEFSLAYADQNEGDYAALQDAVATGRLEDAVGI